MYDILYLVVHIVPCCKVLKMGPSHLHCVFLILNETLITQCEQNLSEENEKNSYLVPQGCSYLVDYSTQLSVLSRVADVRPGAQGDEGQSHDHVAQTGYDVQPNEPSHTSNHIRDKDDDKQCGWGASCMEDIFAIIVLDVLDVKFVYLALQLLQVPPAELLAAHLLHPSEQLHRFFFQLQVLALQVVRGQKWFVTTTNLSEREVLVYVSGSK